MYLNWIGFTCLALLIKDEVRQEKPVCRELVLLTPWFCVSGVVHGTDYN